jgi:hypothetical protein
MARALGAYLKDRDFSAFGPYPAWAEPILKAIGTAVSTLPDPAKQFAHDQGYRLIRIVFDHPEDPSPLVADFYRAWYQRRKLMANRLLMANFILMEPYWTLRTGSVPFWTAFNAQPSAENLERYLKANEMNRTTTFT